MKSKNKMNGKRKQNKSVRAKLIVNPGSGQTSGRLKLIEQAVHLLTAQGMAVDVALAKPKKMAVPIAKQAVKDGYKVVIAMGGDDTIEAIIRGIAGSKARLGIIPAGTNNNLALSLHIPEDLQKACAIIVNDQAHKLDMGQIKVKGKKFKFFEVVTIGLGAAIYPDIKEIPKGNLASLKDAVLTILNHKTKPKVSIELDDESKITVETMLMIVTNIPYIGQKFLVSPDASVNDGLLDIAVYPEFSKPELLTYFGKVMNQGRTEDGKIQRYRAHKIKVKTSPELKLMADGIMLGSGPIKIKVLSGALRVIVPDAFVKVADIQKEANMKLQAPLSPVAAGTL
jgi:diacylglycerol kinase (ATP)